jgi:hypothetical protein
MDGRAGTPRAVARSVLISGMMTTSRLLGVALATTLVIGGAALTTGCREEGPAERVGEKLDRKLDKLEDKIDPPGAAEKAGRKIDRAIDDAKD